MRSRLSLIARFNQMNKATAQDTRRRIADAALKALQTEGFAGATSRAIARIGGFNQALIFYHYGSLENLLLAALDLSSEERMSRYRAALAGATTPRELARVAREIYREDSESGHVAVISQLVAGSVSHPELAQGIVDRMEPWVDLCAETIRRVVAGTPLEPVVPVDDVAYALVTFYLGANLLTHLDDARRTTDLLEHLEALAAVLPP